MPLGHGTALGMVRSALAAKGPDAIHLYIMETRPYNQVMFYLHIYVAGFFEFFARPIVRSLTTSC